ncbi:auxin efflux carrier component [Glycine max]|uniref:Auxin efflux carrier component n=1 Tax=Glycine max TaxID=3847 RepID=M9WUJ7_SOYBN|nr:auxin efflux carrier component [Glycine max]AGJ95059.1 PIN8a [Glycine max]|eukprot:NP_001276251.1 PIN auxin efflux transporter family protein [Glycine max]
MISLADAYHVVASTVPLYVTMILAYISVKWWKIFTPDQCSGINKFVAKFSIPLLSFQVISSNNIYKMSLKLIYADFLQKLLAFLVLIAITKISGRGGLKWIITGLSITTLPNTLILGIPLVKAMYKSEAVVLLAQIIFLQSMIWYNLLLFLYELDAVKTRPTAAASSSQGSDHTSTNDYNFLSTKFSKAIIDIVACIITNVIQYKNLMHEYSMKTCFSKSFEGNQRQLGWSDNKSFRACTNTYKYLHKTVPEMKMKLIKNPNTYATLLGFIWSSIKFRWGLHMPEVVSQSIEILSNGGLGMAMFSLGLFMASQSSIIACGPRMAMVAIGLKVVLGPTLMAVASFVIGLRDTLFKVAIVQAALPQGIVPFVFAKEYNVHPAVLSTAILLGMLIALPVELAFYFLLAI